MIDNSTKFEPKEWQARIQLAATYRIFAYLGWFELIYNHITLRVPGSEEHFLINPFGLMYEEVCASNLVKVDLAGNIIDKSEWSINTAGFTTHSAIHTHIPDAHCIMHIHTTAGLAVACSKSGLSMNNIYSAQLYDLVAYHDFEGITVYPDEGLRLIQSIDNKPALIMRNHGLLAWGDTVARAFTTLWLLNRACEIQLASQSMGPTIEVSKEIQLKCTRDSFHFNRNYGAGQDVFDALIRVIDKIDPTYKH